MKVAIFNKKFINNEVNFQINKTIVLYIYIYIKV